MANENEGPRAGSRAAVIGGRHAAAWAGALTGDFFPAIRREFASAAHSETEAARLAPWLPVCFGIGILFYFAAPQEASFWVAAGMFLVLTLIVFISREKPIAFAVSLALAATAAGTRFKKAETVQKTDARSPLARAGEIPVPEEDESDDE